MRWAVTALRSRRRIAKQYNVRQTTLSRALRSMDLRPIEADHRCGETSDPEFDMKMTEIVGLYMHPPENAMVTRAADDGAR